MLGFSAGGHLAADISTHFERRAYARLDAVDDLCCRPYFALVLYPGHLWIDDVRNSLVYDAALVKAGVPAELHLFEHGGHAFGLRRTREPITAWPDAAMAWLAKLGIVRDRRSSYSTASGR